MRFLAVDWGTSRLRAYLVADGAVLGRAESEEGIARLRAGEHEAALGRVLGVPSLDDPGLPVVLVGMVGSREGWFPAPYAACPAGPDEIAAAALPVDLGAGRQGLVIPGVRADDGTGTDVMRGEETHLLGSGVRDGLVCLPGTHSKWAEMRGGRIARFATFMTGEMHGLLLQHSMIGRPAEVPGDPAGFALGLDHVSADREGSLLNRLFRARAATVTGMLEARLLGSYLSGLLTGDEVAGALRLFGRPGDVTVVAEPARADLYAEALARSGIETHRLAPEQTFAAGLAAILRGRGSLR